MMINIRNNIRYNDSKAYFRAIYPGKKVQKISVQAGFTCPNRDGTRGRGGCSYCLNQSFLPQYTSQAKGIKQQLQDGMEFFSHKYPEMKFLAYFQSFTNTYAPLSQLKAMYEEALAQPGVIGLAISTRPDCLPDQVLDYLAGLSRDYHISLEIGIESTLDRTLKRINRGHTFAETADAIYRAGKRGLHLTGHLILGLPGETRPDILRHARIVSQWPIQNLKLHQLQILRYTQMGKDYNSNPAAFALFDYEQYIDCAIDFLELLHPDMILERFISQAPGGYLIAPKWGQIKNYEVVERIKARLEERNTWQGRLYRENT